MPDCTVGTQNASEHPRTGREGPRTAGDAGRGDEVCAEEVMVFTEFLFYILFRLSSAQQGDFLIRAAQPGRPAAPEP